MPKGTLWGKDASGPPLPNGVSVYVSEPAVTARRHRDGPMGPDAVIREPAAGCHGEFQDAGALCSSPQT